MNRNKIIESLLKKHKFNKERIIFLEHHLKRFSPEVHEDYIEYKMFAPGYSGDTPKFVLDLGVEVAQLNKVEETACEYQAKCSKEYNDAKVETEKELKMLRYYTEVIEDGLNTLRRINEKHWIILDKYYINNYRMEDIAEMIHVSRSRCYDMCKEGIKWMTALIYGENIAM